MLTFGGQTALNCGVELDRRGVFEKYGVKVMGTPLKSIKESEDRQLFAKKVQEIGKQVAPSRIVKTVDEAVVACEELGYPVSNQNNYFRLQICLSFVLRVLPSMCHTLRFPIPVVVPQIQLMKVA